MYAIRSYYAIEECAELITSLMHLKRNKVDEEQIISELADVTLMVSYNFV